MTWSTLEFMGQLLIFKANVWIIYDCLLFFGLRVFVVSPRSVWTKIMHLEYDCRAVGSQ